MMGTNLPVGRAGGPWPKSFILWVRAY